MEGGERRASDLNLLECFLMRGNEAKPELELADGGYLLSERDDFDEEEADTAFGFVEGNGVRGEIDDGDDCREILYFFDR